MRRWQRMTARGGSRAPHVRWWARTVNGLRPDHNPLRRPVDRLEGLATLSLLAVFLIATPLLALGVGRWSWDGGVATAHAERAAWHQVSAVVLRGVPRPQGNPYGAVYLAQVPVRWSAAGTSHTGQVTAAAGVRTGATVSVWTGPSGPADRSAAGRAADRRTRPSSPACWPCSASPCCSAFRRSSSGGYCSGGGWPPGTPNGVPPARCGAITGTRLAGTAGTLRRSRDRDRAGPPDCDTELKNLDAYWRAANYLSVGQIYLLRQPAAARAAAARAHQAAAARALGHHARAEPDLRPPEPGDPGPGPEHALRDRTRPRRPGDRGQHLPRGHLQRALPEHHPGRGRDAPAVPPVLLSRRHPQPRRPGDARLDPRGRRAGLLAGPRLRGGVRQPGPDRGVRRRRRRGRDRPAGHELALQQVPQPGPRRRGAADPAPERLQDRQPDRAGPDPGRGAGLAARGLRLPVYRVDRRRPGPGAPAAGRDARRGRSTRSRAIQRRARERRRTGAGRAGR